MGNVGRLRDGTVIDLVITNRSECTQQQPHTSLTTSRIHPARMHAEHLPLRDTYHTAYTARHRSPPVPPRIPRRPRLQRPPKRSPIQGQGRGRLWRIQPEGTIDVFNRRAAARLVRRASVHLHGQREQRAARATAHATHLLRLRQRPQWPSRVHADPGNPRELDHVVRLRQDGADGGGVQCEWRERQLSSAHSGPAQHRPRGRQPGPLPVPQHRPLCYAPLLLHSPRDRGRQAAGHVHAHWRAAHPLGDLRFPQRRLLRRAPFALRRKRIHGGSRLSLWGLVERHASFLRLLLSLRGGGL